MATNVFGNPVTDETVRLVYPNLITTITARHRADVAVLYMHQENRMDNLNRFVYNLATSNNSETATTLGMIYNATGNNLTFSMRHTWGGDVVQTFYPHLIRNGQWAGFMHMERRTSRPSKEAIVYRGQDEGGAERYWVLAWNTKYFGIPYPNHVYTVIELSQPRPGSSSYWNGIERQMDSVRDSFYSSAWNGCFASATIGTDGRAELVGIMSLAGVTDNSTSPSLGDATLTPEEDDE